MYDRSGESRSAPSRPEDRPGLDPAAPARLAISRVRAALTSFTPGVPFDAARYRASLASAALPQAEGERLLCLGWLDWLGGEPTAASHFAAAAEDARLTNRPELLAESSYWRARVGLLSGEADAVAAYEAVLRTPGMPPRATAWFVDLLWRSGRLERAEQILKTVGSNRRLAACDEVPLLEARSLLRRSDWVSAERVLNEARPAGAVARAERWLLLAWIAASQNRHLEAETRLEQAGQCLCPVQALGEWRRALARRTGAATDDGPAAVSIVLADFLRGQELRASGRHDEAASAYRAALDGPAGPFARYALARLGQYSFAELLAARPGLFLALRCRVRSVLRRFCRRQASPAECLDALVLAAKVGCGGRESDHFRTLATALQGRELTATALRELAATPAADPVARRNYLRAAAELAVRRLPPGEACVLLEEWVGLADADLRAGLERQVLRTRLLSAESHSPALLNSILDASGPAASFPHAAALWSVARRIAAGEGGAESLPSSSLPARWRPLTRALRLYEAARGGDAKAVAALLGEADTWRSFGDRPPRFAVAAVEYAVANRPTDPAWGQALPRWLGLWQGAVSETLAARNAPSSRSAPPPGMPPGPWYLHRAASALSRDDYVEALACVRRVAEADLPDAASAALPELERYARAQTLATVLRPDGLAPTSAALLVDAVDLLSGSPEGIRLLDAAAKGDREAVDSAAAVLSRLPDLAPRLARHFALLTRRSAEFLDAQDRPAEAAAEFRCSWGWWLRFLASVPPDGPSATQAASLVEALLGGHRRRVNGLLARGAVDGARLHWDLVGELPARAAGLDPALGKDFADRVARFRDELATDFLIATRESMRFGPAPEGFRADYEGGLTGLRRILSLDRENPRLLTALVETCGDWFFDLYNAGTGVTLAEQVERFTPFALQLTRLVEGRPGDLAARAALAGFTKFRGFVAADPQRKAELYREALRFNPAEENVRELLARLEGTGR
jgi:hypothetical protein